HASGHDDRLVRAEFRRQLAQFAEPRIELSLRALAHAARVDHYDVGVARIVGRLEAGLLQHARHALRGVDVHLDAERLDEVFPRHLPYFRFRPSAFAFPGSSRTSPERSSSISRADRRRPSEIASPPSMRESSSTRASPPSL